MVDPFLRTAGSVHTATIISMKWQRERTIAIIAEQITAEMRRERIVPSVVIDSVESSSELRVKPENIRRSSNPGLTVVRGFNSSGDFFHKYISILARTLFISLSISLFQNLTTL